ncbi:MAG: TAXI family TRAP transporter solute-binding subunit [Clostridia bacterium]|nr:MAG: TAXI family TRAP transporter solute-binding subunit [Clostridia bacterium]
MRRYSKQFIWLILTVAVMSMAIFLAACGKGTETSSAQKEVARGNGQSASEQSQEPSWKGKVFSAYTSAAGTTTYIGMAAMADLVRNKAGLDIAVTPSSGSGEAQNMVASGQGDFGYTTDFDIGRSYLGEEPYGAENKGNSRYVLRTHSSMVHILARADSGIKTFADLKGKRVMAKSPGSPIWDMEWQAIMDAYGMTENDMVLLPRLTPGEEADALKTGRIDAFGMHGNVPTPTFQELAMTLPIVEVEISGEDRIARIKELAPWVQEGVLPGGIYKGIDNDVPSLWIYAAVGSNKNVPEDVVYTFTKTVWDNIDELKRVHAVFKDFSIKKTLAQRVAPFHQGAIKYYREAGQWTDEMEQFNRDMLQRMGQDR